MIAMEMRSARVIAAAAAGVWLQAALGAPVAWDNTATDFNAGASWTGGTAPANDLLTDVGTFSGTAANQPQLTDNRSIAGLNFQSGGWTLSTATGPFTLTMGGQGIVSVAGTSVISAPLILGAAQTWDVSGTLMTVSGGVSGSGALTKSGAGTLTFNAGNTSTAAITVNGGAINWAGSTNVTNAFSSITVNSGSVTVGDNRLTSGAGGAITVNQAGSFIGGSTSTNTSGSNIIANSMGVVLNGGGFGMNSQKNATEVTGAMTIGAGASRITLTLGQSGNLLTLRPASLTRGAERGTVLVRGSLLGQATQTGLKVTNLTFVSTPGSQLVGGGSGTAGTTNLSILPYLITDNGAAGTESFATYGNGGTGVRPLALTTEYAGFAAAGAGDNVRETGAFATSTRSINSLLLSNAGASYTVTNTGNTVTLGGASQSGALMFNRTAGTGGITIAGGALDFGTREAIIYATTNGVTDVISANINNPAGLTKSGAGNLQLDGVLSTSDIVVNQGILSGSGTLTCNITGGIANLIAVQGGGTLDITNLHLLVSASNLQVGSYVLADYNEGTLVGSQFAGVAGMPGDYAIDYTGGVNDRQVVMQVISIPEPAATMLLALSGAGLIARRRKHAM